MDGPGSGKCYFFCRNLPVAPRASAVSPVRNPLAGRPPGVLRHNRAAPARHPVLPPSRCLRGWRAGVPPLLKPVQQVRQRLHRVSPLLRSTAPIGRPAVSDNRRRLRRRSRDSSLAPRPIGCGSLGGGRGAIAAGWWSWHRSLIFRDASRVQWAGSAPPCCPCLPLRCHRAPPVRRADRSPPGMAEMAEPLLSSKHLGVPL